MTTNEKNAALQELKDAQQEIESMEAEWTRYNESGMSTELIDEIISQRIARRNGILAVLHALKVNVDRKDYRTIDINGKMEIKTIWYLV